VNFSVLRAMVELREDLPLRGRAELPPLEEGFNSDFGSGGGMMGNEGTLFSLRGPPGTVGVGAASKPSLKKELDSSSCHAAGDGCGSPSKLDGLPPKPLAQRWLPKTCA